jgi:hypothetical protein
VRAATVLAADPALANETIPASVALLTQEVIRAMTLSKIKIATVALLTLLAIAAVSLPVFRALPEAPASVRELAPPVDANPQARAAAAALEPANTGDEAVRGSGKQTTKEFKLTGFTSVDASSAFHVEITRGDKFSVAVTADDNLLELIKVAKDGETLHIALEDGKKSIQSGKWKAVITMPKLDGLNISGAVHATLKGFKGGDLKVRAHGASRLDGDIEAGKLDLEAVGASQATLHGSTKDAKLKATGASKLALADFAIDRADVHLSGASSATIKVKEKLDYHVTGASRLQYQGEPTIGTKKATGASSVSGKGK